MPSTKNATNRIRKGRRQGIPATKGNSETIKRGNAGMRRGNSDVPKELPAEPSKKSAAIVSKRKVKRKPEKTAARGESTTPRDTLAARDRQPRKKSTATARA